MKHFQISEKDLESIFKGKRIKRKSRFWRLLKAFSVFVFTYLAAFFLINFSGLRNNLQFWYKTEYKNESYAGTSSANQQSSVDKQTSLPQISDNHINIEVIGVDAPISWRIDNKPDEVKKSLENGVIHLNGTALPGEIGNVFITGHSSDLPWNKGNYKNVFALLNRLVIGDRIQLKYQNNDFVYKVTEIKTVNPDELSVLDQTSDSRLTLMTCTPVGTSLRRLIVIAKQTYPNLNFTPSAQKNSSDQQKQLPKVR